MKIKPFDVDVKVKMLILKATIGALTSLVIGMIVKEEIKVLDDAEEKLKDRAEKKRHAEQENQT